MTIRGDGTAVGDALQYAGAAVTAAADRCGLIERLQDPLLAYIAPPISSIRESVTGAANSVGPGIIWITWW